MEARFMYDSGIKKEVHGSLLFSSIRLPVTVEVCSRAADITQLDSPDIDSNGNLVYDIDGSSV